MCQEMVCQVGRIGPGGGSLSFGGSELEGSPESWETGSEGSCEGSGRGGVAFGSLERTKDRRPFDFEDERSVK